MAVWEGQLLGQKLNSPAWARRTGISLPPSNVPRTLVETCRVLGVELDASEDDIKRVGDALRIPNHPDHARDEADRQLREARSKQINVALDLLLKRKAAGACGATATRYRAMRSTNTASSFARPSA